MRRGHNTGTCQSGPTGEKGRRLDTGGPSPKRIQMTLSAPQLIVIDSACSSYWSAASVQRAVKLLVCLLDGVPLITPVEALSDSPFGRLPADIDHV